MIKIINFLNGLPLKKVFLNLFFLLIFWLPNLISQNLDAGEAFNKGLEMRFQNPDSSIALFKYSYKKYIKLKDTVNATYSLLEKAYVFENTAKYASSYDALWTALILNDKREDDKLKSILYIRLGRIYSYNKREKNAFKYLKKSLELQKNIVNKLQLKKAELVPYYYALVKTNRELEHTKLASTYLDSCYMFFSKETEILPLAHLEYRGKAYLDFEKAILLSQNNKNKEAIKIMDDIYPWFLKNQPTYLVLFYTYLGDMNLALLDIKKSEEFYRKAIKVSNDNKSHVDFTPLIYEKLTKLYLQKKDYKNAFESLNMAKKLDALFFDGRSSINQSLLEIKDNYRLKKEKQKKLIQEQRLKQFKQEDKIIRLQRIILIGSIIFLLFLGYFFFKYLREKHSIEKELIRKTKELEIEKTKELLALKNKELAASALQLIEKDEFLKELKTRIREGGDKVKVHEINKVLRTVSVNNNKNWEEFKMRFIDVNKEFYDIIFKKFPKLSQGDQKICALIKLNFSSKDMARLLGISVESVHTVRHRIRKKMSLERNVNLEDYINSL
ncbi:hypothetical protein MPF19_16785 [Polaribacter sp. Z014]|uniref:hypothetical protein n=1 Tax=Polaribacter sp. Z014 TaxID=2927126 RepID=UPI002020426A|nr:hypothetical protein [Polaribacter sp. Z014]MCL7765082.1 hypothetical protein [Polaribacter sp. Z014]